MQLRIFEKSFSSIALPIHEICGNISRNKLLNYPHSLLQCCERSADTEIVVLHETYFHRKSG